MGNKINRIIIHKNKIKELEIKLAIFFVKYKNNWLLITCII
jgi:hypothetical protein